MLVRAKKFLTKAASNFDAKKASKNIKDAINNMQSDIMNIGMTIDDAEESTPYKLDRISIDRTISRIDKDLENLSNYCEKLFKNYKTEL